MGEDRKPWDRQDAEPMRAYDAFCAYRDLGVSRSIDRAYRLYQRGREVASEGLEVATKRKRATGRWGIWASQWDWKDRAERYDSHLESERRKVKENEHFDQLRSHLDRQRTVAIALTGTALRMLQLVQDELRNQPNPDIAAGRHTLVPTKIPAFARTAALMARIALEAEGDALGIEQMLGNLDEQTP